jgi:uncharacterized protein YeaO (DUF488 family)
MIQIKRIYEPYSNTDEYRILVDRLWPRGISKEKAYINEWLKDIAPTNTLRKWFNHDTEKWEEFKKKYKEELKNKKELLSHIKQQEKIHKTITLLYGAKDTEHNQAKVLENLLKHE